MVYATRQQFIDWTSHDPVRANSTDAEKIDRNLRASESEIDRICNRRFNAPPSAAETWRHFLSPTMGLARTEMFIRDAVTVTAVETSGGSILVEGVDYVLYRKFDDWPATRLIRLNGNWPAPYVDVTGTFGWADGTEPVSPDAITEATILKAYTLYKRRQADFGADGMMSLLTPRDRDVWDLIIGYRRRARAGMLRPVKIG